MAGSCVIRRVGELGFGGVGFRVWGLGFRVQGLGMDPGPSFSSIRVQGNLLGGTLGRRSAILG